MWRRSLRHRTWFNPGESDTTIHLDRARDPSDSGETRMARWIFGREAVRDGERDLMGTQIFGLSQREIAAVKVDLDGRKKDLGWKGTGAGGRGICGHVQAGRQQPPC